MPRIAYLTPLYFADESCIGGGERYPTNLARGVALASGGRHRVDIISFGRTAAVVEVAPGVTLRVLAAASQPSNPLDVLSWDLPDALADADLVHVHQAYTRCSEVGILVAKALRKPVCVTDHGAETSRLGQQYGITELADLVVAYSDFGASRHKVRTPVAVVKGGVDVRAFAPPDAPVRREFVLCVARILPHKGIDRLILAAPADMPVVVCGRASRPEYLDRLRSLARGKDVRFLLDVQDEGLVDLYHRAWANVLPSVHLDCYGDYYAAPELMGLTLLEAMACGTPAIGSNLAAMPEFIRPGETGYVFDTIEELRDQLTGLVGDPGLLERMGLEARRAVAADYSIEVAGAAMAGLYDGLLARKREAAA